MGGEYGLLDPIIQTGRHRSGAVEEGNRAGFVDSPVRQRREAAYPPVVVGVDSALL
jgi:hypothetical protein